MLHYNHTSSTNLKIYSLEKNLFEEKNLRLSLTVFSPGVMQKNAQSKTSSNHFGTTLDRSGLRPTCYYITMVDQVYLSSEIRVNPGLKDIDVKIKHRLEPGKMLLVHFLPRQVPLL
jgi:hypothetical protein